MAKTNKVDLSEVFQDGDVPTGQDFKNLISSSLNLNETGSTIQVLSSSLIVSGALNVTGSISCSGNIEGDSFTVRGLTFIDTTTHSTTESVSFGVSASSDQHRFTGSVFITGSEFDVKVGDSGSINFSTTSGSINLNGTSSFAGPINRFTGSIFQTGSNSQSVSFLSSVSIGTITTSQSLHGGLSIKKINTMGVNLNPTSQSISSSILITGSGDFGHLGIDSNEILNYHHDLSIGSFGGDRASRGNIKLLTSVGTGSEDENYNQGVRMFISASGRVGIGTVTPSYILDVDTSKNLGGTAGNSSSLLRLSYDASNNNQLLFTGLRTSNGTDWETSGTRIQAKTDSTWQGYIQFNGDNNHGITLGAGNNTTSANTTAEYMRIDQNGKIGMGTTQPSERLSVVGSISASGAVSASKIFLSGNELNIGGGIFTSASLAGGGGGAVTSVANGADNRVATFGGTGTLNGESSLIFTGDGLKITGSFSPLSVRRYGSSGPSGANTTIAEFRSGADLKTSFSTVGEIFNKSNIYHSQSFYGNKIRLARMRGSGTSTNLTNPEIIFSNNHSDNYDSHHPTSTNTHFRDGESYSFGMESKTGGIKLASLGGGKFIDPEGNDNSMDFFLKSFKLMEWTDQAPPSADNVYDIYDLGTEGYWYGRGVLYARNAHTSGTEVSRASKCIDFGHNKSNSDSQDTTGVRVGIAGAGDYTGTNKLYVHGTIRSTQSSNNTSSDRRFKENIKDLEPQLDIIKKLKPRRFDWKKDSPNYEDRFDKVKNQPGFIAQEVEDLIPNMVIKDQTPEGYMTLNSSDLIPILIKATQEQQEIIESLTKRIEDLENK